MTGRLFRALAVVSTLASSAVMAQETEAAATAPASAEKSGLEVSLAVGFQAGAGYVYKNGLRLDGQVGDVKLSDTANGGLVLAADLGYRINDHWFVGAFGQYSKVLVKNNPYSCPDGYDCSTNQIRLGPQVQYHFSPKASFDPWVGLGFGIVLLSSKIEGPLSIPTPAGTLTGHLAIDSKLRGPEYVSLTVGGKWNFGDNFAFGPYLNGTYARYTVRAGTTTVTLPPELGGTSTTSDLGPVDDGPYGLIILGVRGTFTL
ncbi:outer membrane beta-barrel protein [Pyxidicoccus parkwayensis]|uniref:Outer membrane beta-barrel protein n=2 Tax=Pyxidicoccus parkwayensis TaxID=2813578 RepID=A0ABX7P2K8_9BACT|nr:outer membrane beta-barrel protein [Pyxidicoccus parkwaysis]